MNNNFSQLLYESKYRNLFYIQEHIKLNWLNESKHLYEPNEDSQFRKYIDYIINTIIDKLKYTETKQVIIYDDYPQFKEIIFNNPFKLDKNLCIIEKLKIYISLNSNIVDAFTVNDESINNDVFNEFNPVFKQINNHILVLSIFILLPKKYQFNQKLLKNKLYEIIPHELTHTLDNIRNKIESYNAGSLNELRSYLLNAFEISGEVLKNKEINNKNDFIELITNLIYYTLKTEINAYIESFYNEIKKLNKTINKSLYYEVYNSLNELIDIINNDIDFYEKKYEKWIDLFLRMLKTVLIQTLLKHEKYPNYIFNAKYSFRKLLRFWKYRINLFLTNANKIYKEHL